MPAKNELSSPGTGSIVVDVVAGTSTVTSAIAKAPLKLLVPRPRGASVWAYAATFGGGLLAGDAVDFDIRVGAGAAALCATQASTKVYKSDNGSSARQTSSAVVDENALLAWLPDPVCAFAGARYEQRQTIDLAHNASLVLVDSLLSGRVARDERYRFASFRTKTDIRIDGKLVALDAMTLEDTPQSTVAERMGRFDAWATVFLLGPRVAVNAAALVESFAKEPVNSSEHVQRRVLVSASAIQGGAVLRVAAETPEATTIRIRRALDFLPALLGDDPWARKW